MLHDSPPEFGAPGIVMRISFDGVAAGVALVANASGPLKITSSGMIRNNRVKDWINVQPLPSICFAVSQRRSPFPEDV